MPANSQVIKVEDVMTRNVVSIDGMATIREAAEKMRSENVTALLVDKRNANDAWGIVTIPDLVGKVISPGRSPDDTNVYEVMTKPVVTVPSDMDIRYVARLLHRIGVRKAPVIDSGKLVGIISMSDLILREGVL